METQHVLPAPVAKEPFSFSNFLQFRRMLTLQIILIMYAVVAVLISLGSLDIMFSSGRRSYYNDGFNLFGGGSFLSGLAMLVFGNVVWRM